VDNDTSLQRCYSAFGCRQSITRRTYNSPSRPLQKSHQPPGTYVLSADGLLILDSNASAEGTPSYSSRLLLW